VALPVASPDPPGGSRAAEPASAAGRDLEVPNATYPTYSTYSTVTDLARLRGWSTSNPLAAAISQAKT
jgi:hypothetical protein